MRRLGVMGGTFDPIHHGHLVAANEVGCALELDEVIFVPAGRPWQKDASVLAPARHRYQMTLLATATNPLFSVSRVDVDRPGATYSVDTLRDLRAERGQDAEFFFIAGADALSGLRTWKEPDELLTLARFVGCTRPGHRLTGPVAADAADGRFTLVEVPALEISSSTCRDRVRAGLPLRYLVPDPVAGYIAERGLYGGRNT
jgi:nicotinate-nucleotide adenylyltransferase